MAAWTTLLLITTQEQEEEVIAATLSRRWCNTGIERAHRRTQMKTSPLTSRTTWMNPKSRMIINSKKGFISLALKFTSHRLNMWQGLNFITALDSPRIWTTRSSTINSNNNNHNNLILNNLNNNNSLLINSSNNSTIGNLNTFMLRKIRQQW